MSNNVVNACGRTELNGNVDVGQETEKELTAKRVTSVKKGSVLAVTIHQVSSFPRIIYILIHLYVHFESNTDCLHEGER
jgi:Protein of unknown function (DUF3129).